MPLFATIICIVFILYLFWVDAKRSDVSKALWIPLIWMFLAGSRFVSHWLNLRDAMPADVAMEAYLEGSPLDRTVFSALIAAAVIALLRRRLDWGQLLRQNSWIWAFLLFGAVSAAWSENPLLSSKRLFKATGTVIMALLILTEKHPYVAVGVVLRRLAFLTLPLSLVFIKYFPDLGRGYHQGRPVFTGVAMGKNGLGQLCLLGGIYFCWSLFHRPDQPLRLGGPLRIRVEAVFLLLIAWLLAMANSATSLVTLLLAACLLLLSRVPFVARSPRRIMSLAMISVLLVGLLNLIVDVRGSVIAGLDRDPTLTTRVPMWQELLAAATNPIGGSGYEVFWASEQGRVMQERWGVAQAHNGYLELYLNLGIIGLAFILGSIASGLLKIRHQLSIDYRAAVLRLCSILVIGLYNWTEATFGGVSNIWLLFFLTIMDVRGRLSSDEAVGESCIEQTTNFHVRPLNPSPSKPRVAPLNSRSDQGR